MNGEGEKNPLERIAKWIGGITALIVAIAGLRAAVQQLIPSTPVQPAKTTDTVVANSDAAMREAKATDTAVPNSDAAMREATTADYAIPDSDARRLVRADLIGLSSVQLGVARNEIYARHGWRFRTADLQAYFARKSWYSPAPSNESVVLNPVEKYNIQLIRSVEKEKGG